MHPDACVSEQNTSEAPPNAVQLPGFLILGIIHRRGDHTIADLHTPPSIASQRPGANVRRISLSGLMRRCKIGLLHCQVVRLLAFAAAQCNVCIKFPVSKPPDVTLPWAYPTAL